MPTYTESAGTIANLSRSGSIGAWTLTTNWNSPAITYPNYSDYVLFTNFGFSIPSSEVVQSIEVIFNCASIIVPTNSYVKNSIVSLYEAGLTGNNLGGSTAWPTGTPGPISIYSLLAGWGVALTATQANASTFGFAVSGIYSANSPSISCALEMLSNAQIVIVTAVTRNPALVTTILTAAEQRIPPLRRINGSR
jgi:hypothetical protein